VWCDWQSLFWRYGLQHPTKNALKETRRGRRGGGAEARLEGNKTKWSHWVKTENLVCGLD